MSFIFASSACFQQCHASTLVKLPDGRLASAWFAGTKEGAGDTGIWYSVLDGNDWRPPALLVKINEQAHWNPVLFVDAQDKIHLYFKVGDSPWTWRTYHTTTRDIDGRWSTPHSRLLNADFGPVRAKILRLSNGDLLAPASSEIPTGQQTPEGRPLFAWESRVDRSCNDAKSWSRGKNVFLDRHKFGPTGGVIQPVLWESKPGQVHMFMRSTYGVICRSDSADYGKTWSPVQETKLPNNNSAMDIAKVGDSLVMILNPVSGNWAARTPIILAFSHGAGYEWRSTHVIEEGEGSFAYPAIIPISFNKVAFTYTWNRLLIAFGTKVIQNNAVKPTLLLQA